jgi:cell division protein FtsW
MIIGLGVVFITHLIPFRYYSRLSQIFLFISIPLLLLTLVMGTSLNQASRWLTLPGIGLTIQTSDFAKLSLVMYLARMLSLKQDTIKDFKHTFIPTLLPVIIVCVLILPANLSTALMIFVVSIILMFIGRISIKHLSLLGLVGIAGMVLFILLAPYLHLGGRLKTWQNRIENYISGDEDENNFQAEQSKIAIATGGVLGKGPGNSTERNFLPHPYSDFIYAIIIEEYGLIGGIVVIILYLVLLYRAGVIVRKCDRTFPAFLVIGLAVSMVFQAMINMAVAVNIFPVTGQTLPFISMGGSSLLFSGTTFGIILSVSKSIAEPEKENSKKEDKDTADENTELNEQEQESDN